jgi:hypothetical protein
MVRELKEGFLAWLSGRLLPSLPSLADYDTFARQWIQEVVLERCHRTTKRVTGRAWLEEREQLTVIPGRVRTRYAANLVVLPATVTSAEQRRVGEVVQLRDLREYEAVVR